MEPSGYRAEHEHPSLYLDPVTGWVEKGQLNYLFSVDKSLVRLHEMDKGYRTVINHGVSTGWKSLDRLMQGLRPGEVTVVTADTGVGKTTFCTQLMVNVAMQGGAVWINSWEMKPQMIMRKLASIALRKHMKMKEFTLEESQQFDIFAKNHRIYINESTIGTDVDALGEQLKCAQALGIQVVLLDHLDYLVNTRKEKVHEAIDDTVKRLHELAFSLSMHFILICHPRQSATPNEEIGMHALKGSSSIKQYADNIIILHRCSRTDSGYENNRVKVRVAKNRMFGYEGNIYLQYCPEWDGYLEPKEGKA